ncbi:MAG TPA: type IV toxin-antitoxin system AbiEi family antitoxin [Cellulomonadaceae bacterium]|nr:type IV toxin-antitoxin system AbiEi family antitoxin [Cellulomonadaceae bacterium]
MNSSSITLATVRALEGSGIMVRAAGGAPAVDRRRSVTVTVSGRSRAYSVEARTRVSASVAAAVDVPPGTPLLVVAPVIDDAAAEVFRARGIDFADTVGNVRLAWEGVLVDMRGRRLPRGVRVRRPTVAARAFTRSGAQVIFVLLSRADGATLSLRELARVSGVSLGTAQIVVDDLTRGGFLASGPGGRAVTRGGELLSRWTEAYVVSLAGKLPLASFSVPDPRWWDATDPLTAGLLVGGDLAAGFVDRTGSASITLYAERIPTALVARHRMRRDDDRGTLHVRRRFWQPDDGSGHGAGTIGSAREAGGAPLVPAPLVYADLVASGDPHRRVHADLMRAQDPLLAQLDRT